MSFIRLVIFIAALLLTGCAIAPKALSRDEWLANTNRVFEGVTSEQALKAVDRLLRLADGDDFEIQHHDSGLTAKRLWIAYAVIVAVRGVDLWSVKAQPTASGVRVSIAVRTHSGAVHVQPYGSGNYGVGSTGPTGGQTNGTALYDVFWARMEYLLGKRSQWMTCVEADDRVRNKIVWGSNEALCNSFNMQDEHPKGQAKGS